MDTNQTCPACGNPITKDKAYFVIPAKQGPPTQLHYDCAIIDLWDHEKRMGYKLCKAPYPHSHADDAIDPYLQTR